MRGKARRRLVHDQHAGATRQCLGDLRHLLAGNAKAAARLTTPRIPAQATMVVCATGGGGTRRPPRGNSRRGAQVEGNTQRKRLAIKAPDTAAAMPADNA